MSKVNFTTVVIPESVKEQLKKEVSEAFPGVVVTVNNLNIWVSGDTKPIKDELKAFGFRWAAKRSAWFMRIPDNAKPYDGYQEQPEEQPEESEQMKQIRAMLEQYKAGEISYDEYMERQKAICAECSARCAVKVAGDVAPALEKDGSYSLEPCHHAFPLEKIVLKITREGDDGAYYAESHYLVNTTRNGYHHRVDNKLLHTWDIDMNHIAGYLPAPKEEAETEPAPRPELTEEQQKLVNYYREYAKRLMFFVKCEHEISKMLKGYEKPINKTFIDKMLEAVRAMADREEMGHVYASWNCYNPKRLDISYYPNNSNYQIAGLSLLVESKTQKLTAEGKKILLEAIDGQIKYHAERAERYENMADHYAEYLEAKKHRDTAILEANEAFNANKTFAECESDEKYNSSYGRYNYQF